MSEADPRQRLLDASLRLFADRGFAGTAVQDIIEAAGVTKPVLYYYFESKGGLFQALIDRAVEERLRLMQEAAPARKPTVEALTDILVALTEFARQQPDLLRLSFAVAFAAPGEMPVGFRLPVKIGESIQFVHQLIETGREAGELNRAFTTQELLEGYFQMVQHQVALAVLCARTPPPGLPPMPPPASPERAIALFLTGSAPRKAGSSRLGSAAKSLVAVGLFALLSSGAPAQEMKPKLATDPGVSTNVVPTAPAASNPNAPVTDTEAAAPESPVATSGPTTADVRPVPLAVRASHPELATVSPIEANAHDPHALDLETCFQLTAMRDDSLKIDLADIEVARAQLSQSLAALWPTFNVTNQQQFLHYSGSGANGGLSFANLASTGTPTSGAGFTGTGTGVGQTGTSTGTTGTGFTTGSAGTPETSLSETSGNRTHTSQSNVTMSYTIFNGGQNYNNVGASRAAVAAKRETLAREYETIYQDVAQGFYNALEYEGDLVIQHDLIEALSARVDDLIGRVQLGRSRPSEMLQAQTDLANARVTYEQQVGSTNAALETVAFYIGIPAGHFALKDTGRFPSANQLEYYLQQSGDRPDVLSQVDSLRQAERNLSVAKGQLFPTVTASGDYLAQQDPQDNNVDATLSLQISMPIFDGGLILAQIHQNHEMVRQSALNVEQLERTADQDTRTAYVNFKAAVAQVVVLREAARFAAKNLEAQVEDYHRGVVSNLDVLTALQDYQTARIQLHNANMTARVNLINLHVAAGTAARGPGADNRALPAHVEGVAP